MNVLSSIPSEMATDPSIGDDGSVTVDGADR